MTGLVAFLVVAVLAVIFRPPPRLVLAGLCLVWVGIMAAVLLLPAGHSLREGLGGDWRPWAALGVAAALALAYRGILQALRARAVSPAMAIAQDAPFSDAELDRYARHIVLREVGGMGQRRLKDARVLVVGAGGLGSPALLYLAAAGVGTIGVVDDDVVSNSNLQRQVIHRDRDIGQPKVFSAQAAMTALNPFIEVRPYNRRLTAEDAEALFAEYDLILDGSDNFDTRYLVNRAAVAAGKPLISAAISQWEGQISLYHPAGGGPCYACVFPRRPAAGLAPACAEAGVMGALPGVVGSMMAVEAIKQITGAGQTLMGRLMVYDALYADCRTIALAPDPDCPVCAAHRSG